jgi:hypothetical protein
MRIIRKHQPKELLLKFRIPLSEFQVKEGHHGKRSEKKDKTVCCNDYPYRGFTAEDNGGAGNWEATSKIGHLGGCELSGGESV